MTEIIQQGVAKNPRTILMRARWALGGLLVGGLAGAWAGGGTDRFGEEENMVGGVRGAIGSIVRSYQYSVAAIKDCMAKEHCHVRNLSLGRRIETRLWQDKRINAEAIVVAVEADGKAILMGQVADQDHKERAVALASDTRGVESVVDQLAVAGEPRTIDTDSSPPVRTGVTNGPSILR